MNLEDNPDDEAIERRFQRNTWFVLSVALIASLVWGSMRLTLGIALGGAMSLFNQRWLEGSVRGILSKAVVLQNGRVPPWTASKLILRYFILALVLGIAVWTGAFHPLGIAIGFASFVGGVMMEAGYQMYLALKSN